MKPVDMSPAAITHRLELMSHLRDFCVVLSKATPVIEPLAAGQPGSVAPRQAKQDALDTNSASGPELTDLQADA